MLAPLGPRKRPNGQTYHPRSLGGMEDVAVLHSAREHHEHMLLAGPAGTGKTALAEAAFGPEATPERPGLETIVCTADTTEADLVGTFVQDPATGTFTWVDGPLTRSVRHDVPLLVDEIALADPRVLSVLYPLMDGRGVLQVTANPRLDPLEVGANWFVIGAYNPDAPGAQLADALRDRFVHHVEVLTDWALAEELGVPPGVRAVARNLELRRGKGEISWAPQMRSLLAFRDQASRYGEEFAAGSLAAKAPEGDRDVVVDALRTRFPGLDVLRLGVRYTA